MPSKADTGERKKGELRSQSKDFWARVTGRKRDSLAVSDEDGAHRWGLGWVTNAWPRVCKPAGEPRFRLWNPPHAPREVPATATGHRCPRDGQEQPLPHLTSLLTARGNRTHSQQDKRLRHELSVTKQMNHSRGSEDVERVGESRVAGENMRAWLPPKTQPLHP